MADFDNFHPAIILSAVVNDATPLQLYENRMQTGLWSGRAGDQLPSNILRGHGFNVLSVLLYVKWHSLQHLYLHMHGLELQLSGKVPVHFGKGPHEWGDYAFLQAHLNLGSSSVTCWAFPRTTCIAIPTGLPHPVSPAFDLHGCLTSKSCSLPSGPKQ